MNKKSQLKIQVLKNLKIFLGPSSSTKAQLKIQEMAFMLVAVMLFFILVGLFVMSIVFTGLQDEATRIAEQKTLAVVTSLANTPELSCIAAKANCVDGDKLISLINLNDSSYENFWPFSSLKVIKQSGFGKDDDDLILCTYANYPNCELFEVYDKEATNERAVESFVALCRKDFENEKTFDRCEVAKIIAGTEFKRIE